MAVNRLENGPLSLSGRTEFDSLAFLQSLFDVGVAFSFETRAVSARLGQQGPNFKSLVNSLGG